jgi:hypothetical protein
MKAFSKNGKSCLCQVPRLQRRATLPASGCKFCECKGCNPIDIRRDKRQEIKNKLKKDAGGKYHSKRQRLLDSDDEELLMMNEYDDWNKARREFQAMMANLAAMNPLLMGLGVPMRHPSYILGRPVEPRQAEPVYNPQPYPVPPPQPRLVNPEPPQIQLPPGIREPPQYLAGGGPPPQ